jgi:hypothetical protein
MTILEFLESQGLHVNHDYVTVEWSFEKLGGFQSNMHNLDNPLEIFGVSRSNIVFLPADHEDSWVLSLHLNMKGLEEYCSNTPSNTQLIQDLNEKFFVKEPKTMEASLWLLEEAGFRHNQSFFQLNDVLNWFGNHSRITMENLLKNIKQEDKLICREYDNTEKWYISLKGIIELEPVLRDVDLSDFISKFNL